MVVMKALSILLVEKMDSLRAFDSVDRKYSVPRWDLMMAQLMILW